MTQPSDVQDGGTSPAPRLSRFWLVTAVLVPSALGVLRKDVSIADSWQLPAAGAALTLFLLAFAKSLDLAVKEPQR